MTYAIIALALTNMPILPVCSSLGLTIGGQQNKVAVNGAMLLGLNLCTVIIAPCLNQISKVDDTVRDNSTYDEILSIQRTKSHYLNYMVVLITALATILFLFVK